MRFLKLSTALALVAFAAPAHAGMDEAREFLDNELDGTSVLSREEQAAEMQWFVDAAAGVLTIIPGALVIWFVRNYIAKGFALGRV